MLQVIVIQESEAGKTFTPLNLYPNTQINIIWENPFFLFDEISALFSLSFNLPSTPLNLSMFNYPNRIPITGVIEKFPAIIKHSGLQIAHGELLLFMFNEEIQTQFVGSVEITKRPLSELDLGHEEFNVDTYGVMNFGTHPNELNYSDAKWTDYKATALARSQHEEEFPFCIAPVRKKDVEWDGHEALFGLKNSLYQYFNFFNAKEKDFHLGNPHHAHTPVIPFPAVRAIVDQIFGDTLYDNLFNHDDLANVVIISPGHPNYSDELYQTSVEQGNPPIFMGWYEYVSIKEFMLPVNENNLFLTLSVLGTDLEWYIQRFMPQYPGNTAIKDLLKIFGITLFRVNNQFHMEFNDHIFTRDVFSSWDGFLDGNPILIREPAKNYSFTYNGEKSSFEGKVFEYDNWTDAFNAAIEAQTNIEYFYKITDSPQVLSITKTLRGETNQPWLKAKVVQTALDTTVNQQHEETLAIASGIKPLNMNIEHYWWQNHNFANAEDPEDPLGILWGVPGDLLFRGHWHVPIVDQVKKDQAPHIMLFAGRKPTFSAGIGQTLLSPPGSLTATRDPLDDDIILITFTDDNGFPDSGGPHQKGYVGYFIEYKYSTSVSWIYQATLFPAVDWDVEYPNVETSMVSPIVSGEDIFIRVWAFSGPLTSQIATIEIDGSPQYSDPLSEFHGDEYPYLTNHHTDHLGNRMFDFSLIPDAPDGIIQSFHGKMKEWCEQDKLRVQAMFQFTALELMQVDMRDKILLHGRKFFIEKLQFTLTPTHISTTEATLISCLPPNTEGST